MVCAAPDRITPRGTWCVQTLAVPVFHVLLPGGNNIVVFSLLLIMLNFWLSFFQDGRNIWPWFPAVHTLLWRKWSAWQIWWNGASPSPNKQQPGFRFVGLFLIHKLDYLQSLCFIYDALYCHIYIHHAVFNFLKLKHNKIVSSFSFLPPIPSMSSLWSFEFKTVYHLVWLRATLAEISAGSFNFCVLGRLLILCLILLFITAGLEGRLLPYMNYVSSNIY